MADLTKCVRCGDPLSEARQKLPPASGGRHCPKCYNSAAPKAELTQQSDLGKLISDTVKSIPSTKYEY